MAEEVLWSGVTSPGKGPDTYTELKDTWMPSNTLEYYLNHFWVHFTTTRFSPETLISSKIMIQSTHLSLKKKWFQDKNIKLLPWLASSPDQNKIEHVWDHIDHKICTQERKPRNMDKLWNFLQKE